MPGWMVAELLVEETREVLALRWHTSLSLDLSPNTQVTMSSSWIADIWSSHKKFSHSRNPSSGKEWILAIPKPELPSTLRTICTVVEARLKGWRHKPMFIMRSWNSVIMKIEMHSLLDYSPQNTDSLWTITCISGAWNSIKSGTWDSAGRTMDEDTHTGHC